MIKDQDELIYITDENGKEIPFRVLKDFTNEETKKHYIFYISAEDDADEVFVAELVSDNNGEGELVDVTDEKEMEFCNEVFEEFLNELDAEALEDEELEDDEEIEA